MAERIGRSFADLINIMEQLITGLKSAKEDAKQKKYAEELSQFLSSLRSLDERQEKAKAELHTVSKELKQNEKEVRALLGKVVSYLESEYGKSSPELQKYGIARRQPGGRKGQRQPKG